MTKTEIHKALLKLNTHELSEALQKGASRKELLKLLPLYILPEGLTLPPNGIESDLDLEVSLEGFIGWMISMHLQTDGDDIFLIGDHPDGSGDGILHGFFYVSENM
jgi:hypothetical protein